MAAPRRPLRSGVNADRILSILSIAEMIISVAAASPFWVVDPADGAPAQRADASL